jgi:hypothetical protein
MQEKTPTGHMFEIVNGEQIINVCRLEMTAMLVTFAVNLAKCVLAAMSVRASANLSKERETRRQTEMAVEVQVKVRRESLQIVVQTITGAEACVLKKDRIVTLATFAVVLGKSALAVTSAHAVVRTAATRNWSMSST